MEMVIKITTRILLVLALTLFILTPTSLAGDISATTKDGRNVILRENGKWEFLNNETNIKNPTFALPPGQTDGIRGALTRKRPTAGKFSLIPKIGTDFTVGGKFVNAARISETFTISGVTITDAISGRSQDFDDVYRMPVSAGLTLNYGLTDYTEIFLALNQLTAEARRFKAAVFEITGTVGSTTVSASEQFIAKFDDYHEVGLNIGTRRFFNRFGALSPYVSIEGGIKHTDKIKVDWTIAGETISDISFYEESWTPNAGISVGLSFEIKDNISVMAETGLHYDFEMNDDDIDWRGSADYEDVNNAGERWSVPIMFGLRITF